jgi:hypothetical protein
MKEKEGYAMYNLRVTKRPMSCKPGSHLVTAIAWSCHLSCFLPFLGQLINEEEHGRLQELSVTLWILALIKRLRL